MNTEYCWYGCTKCHIDVLILRIITCLSEMQMCLYILCILCQPHTVADNLFFLNKLAK